MNAAMAPNGMMLVFTGLLVRLENEAQLAAGLAVVADVGCPGRDPKALGRERRRERKESAQQSHAGCHGFHGSGARVNPGRRDAGQALGQFEELPEGVDRAGDDVVLAQPALFHGQKMSGGGVLDMGPAECGSSRGCGQPAPQILPDGRADGAGVSGSVHDAGLQDDQGQAGLGHGLGHLVVCHPLGSLVLGQPGTLVVPG